MNSSTFHPFKFKSIREFVFPLIAIAIISCKNDDTGNSQDNLPPNSDISCDTPSFFTDMRDGNIYPIVQIGEQCWMAENLRYSGNIVEVNSGEWFNVNFTEQPAWCYYNYEAENDALYGKLYNQRAVKTGMLCPTGWHIPSDDEWIIVTNELGGLSNAGGKMKAVIGWDEPNTGATNESGFSALPGGVRHGNGDFEFMGTIGIWWSSSDGIVREIHFDDSWVFWGSGPGSSGLSCRCVRD